MFNGTLSYAEFISALREVVLIPNRHWGGEGLLGCVFGCVMDMYRYWISMVDISWEGLAFSTGYLHS